MKRSALKRSTSLRSSSSRLRPFSRKRAAARSTRAAVREAVFERDGHTCRLLALANHRCIGHLTPHHIRKEGQGGAYSLDNLIAVCAGGNDAIETMQLAHALGLVQRRGDTAEETWARLYVCGLAGGPKPGAPPVHLAGCDGDRPEFRDC